MTESRNVERFEAVVLPHLDAAYRLARWLTRSDTDAEDVVQEAVLRAYRFFGDVHGTDVRPWLLTIVRNTSYSWLKRNRRYESSDDGSEDFLDREDEAASPEARLVRIDEAARVHAALDRLRPEHREVVTLRELEGLSYKEIADVTGVSLGTVMSRLSRGRRKLYEVLMAGHHTEVRRELP